jgi:hypothetical protein
MADFISERLRQDNRLVALGSAPNYRDPTLTNRNRFIGDEISCKSSDTSFDCPRSRWMRTFWPCPNTCDNRMEESCDKPRPWYETPGVREHDNHVHDPNPSANLLVNHPCAGFLKLDHPRLGGTPITGQREVACKFVGGLSWVTVDPACVSGCGYVNGV